MGFWTNWKLSLILTVIQTVIQHYFRMLDTNILVYGFIKIMPVIFFSPQNLKSPDKNAHHAGTDLQMYS